MFWERFGHRFLTSNPPKTRPGTLPNAPKMPPRRSKNFPRCPKSYPRCPQDLSKTPQHSSKNAQDASKLPQDPPNTPPRPSKDRFLEVWAGFWEAFLFQSLTTFRKCETKFESKVPSLTCQSLYVNQFSSTGCGGLREAVSMRKTSQCQCQCQCQIKLKLLFL